MTLNHVHLGTKDLKKSVEFYSSVFGFKKKFDHDPGIFLDNEAGLLLVGVFLYNVSTIANAAKIKVSPMTTWLGLQAGFHLIQFMASGFALGFVYSRK